jgi:excisionase family DNA binding protein
MNADIKRLFLDYLELTDDKVAAANLVVADALLSGRSLSKPKTEPELQPGDLLVSEAAKQLRCSEMTIYRLCRDGKLPHYRLGVGRGVIRIRSADLAACQQTCRSLPTDMSAKRRRYLGF